MLSFFPHFKERWAIITSEGSIFFYVNFVIMLSGMHSENLLQQVRRCSQIHVCPHGSTAFPPHSSAFRGLLLIKANRMMWDNRFVDTSASKQEVYCCCCPTPQVAPAFEVSGFTFVLHQEHAELPVQLCRQTLVYEGALFVCRTWTDPEKESQADSDSFSSGLPWCSWALGILSSLGANLVWHANCLQGEITFLWFVLWRLSAGWLCVTE